MKRLVLALAAILPFKSKAFPEYPDKQRYQQFMAFKSSVPIIVDEVTHCEYFINPNGNVTLIEGTCRIDKQKGN